MPDAEPPSPPPVAREPSTVWMVHKETGRAGVRGDLILEPGRLIFRPELRAAKLDTLGETVFALDEISKAARARSSPVLELHVRTVGLPPVVLFYFVKPPDIYSSPLPNPRRHGVTYLVSADAFVGEEVGDWLKAIREALPGKRG
jgi:hypothetical protein